MSDALEIFHPNSVGYDDQEAACIEFLASYIARHHPHSDAAFAELKDCLLPIDNGHAMSILKVARGALVHDSANYVGVAQKEYSRLKSLAPSGDPEDVIVLGVCLAGEFELVEELQKVSAFLRKLEPFISNNPTIADQHISPSLLEEFYHDLKDVSPWRDSYKETRFHAVLDPIAPIRVLAQGSVTGLFSVADKLVGNPSKSRPREQWGLYGGNVSGLILGTADEGYSADQKLKGKHANIHGTVDFKKLENIRLGLDGDVSFCFSILWEKLRHRRTLVLHRITPLWALVPLDLSKIRQHSGVQLSLMKHAWMDGYQYRAASNSFNEDGNGELINACAKTKEGAELEQSKAIENTREFLMTVMDTLNRPLRNVPGFELPPEVRCVDEDATLGTIETPDPTPAKAVHPSTRRGDRFFYPIDLHNLRVLRRIIAWRKENPHPLTKFRAFKLKRGISSELIKLRDFLNSEITLEIRRANGVFEKERVQTLEHLLQGSPNYPWRVRCDIIPAQGRYILALVFNPHGNGR